MNYVTIYQWSSWEVKKPLTRLVQSLSRMQSLKRDNLFLLQRPTDFFNRYLEIYHIKFKNSQTGYIGKTERIFFPFLQEHKCDLSNKNDSAIYRSISHLSRKKIWVLSAIPLVL